jgi:hypothetical protein
MRLLEGVAAGIQLLGRFGMVDLIVACSHWSAACFATGLSPTHLVQQLDRVGGQLEVVAIDPSRHACVCLRCACVDAHKVAERRIRRQLRCRLPLSLLEVWREGSQPTSTKGPECSGSVGMAVTATA